MARIMVVEDDVYMREELTDLLRKSGYETASLFDFENAIPEITEYSPDLVLLDINLPFHSGFEICKELKAKQLGTVLVLTARDKLQDELHALGLGADDYLTKPCNIERLLARIKNLLRRKEEQIRQGLLDGNGFLLDPNTFTIYVGKSSSLMPPNEGKILLGFCHRGTDNQLFVFEAAIDLLSFIQLFPKDWKKRSYLSLGGVSSVALMSFLSERPQITSVFLCLDNDQAGNEACEKLAGEISEGYSVIRLKPSRKDWNEILCDKNTDRKKAIAETITIKVPEAEELVPMLCYEDIKQTSVEWLWFPYIPFGKLTIIQGNPGEGKTYFAMMLTAACTNRKLFPNMEDIEPFNVIYQTAEDGMGDTIKPRLIEAGADLSRVMVIDDTEEALTLSDDRIEKAVRQNRVRLVIIDPVQAFIGADVDMNRANEVRPVFRKLGMIAEKTGCAIVLIGHLNKSSGTQSTYRGLGSIDIMAAVRSLIFIGKVRKDPTTRVLIHEKSSLAPPGETMAFKLGDEDGFRWVGAYEISADELLDGKEGKATETKLERGRKLIRELLADKKEISIRELDEKAKEQGISGRTMRDVRSRMKNELEYQVNEKQENSIRLKE